ncbi:MAG: hypothetical protein J3K34DRAFT_426078 [Monoraphidium minutum]|nr:MAG: hypothetical protein J3K34DRAFT_426078 [Monoraphidium minutum]
MSRRRPGRHPATLRLPPATRAAEPRRCCAAASGPPRRPGADPRPRILQLASGPECFIDPSFKREPPLPPRIRAPKGPVARRAARSPLPPAHIRTKAASDRQPAACRGPALDRGPPTFAVLFPVSYAIRGGQGRPFSRQERPRRAASHPERRGRPPSSRPARAAALQRAARRASAPASLPPPS